MNTNELREKSIDELQKELTALMKEQFNLRMQQGSGQDVKPHLFKQTRQSIARVNTLINEKKSASDQS